MEARRGGYGMPGMSDDIKSRIGQCIAWLSAVLGGLSWEAWIALAGLAISAFISWTNYRSRMLQDRLLLEQAAREQEWHEMEKERMELLRQHPVLAPVDDVYRSSRPPETRR